MKIGLLKCDSVPRDLLSLNGDYSDMFQKLFSDYFEDVEITVYDVTQNEYPASLNEVAGYLSTGSRFSVNDEEPWIIRFRNFIETLFEERKKFVGICFGHQMIAHALGGRVVKSERGWGLGVKRVNILRDMPWMDPPLRGYELIVTHQDQVAVLPPGAVLLGENSHCPFSLYQLDDHFLSMQAHPELEADFITQLLQTRLKSIGKKVIDDALKTLYRRTNRMEVSQWIMNFIRS
jgi:GMP synthase-like glutamine amidotransferase